jgi:hypothetical protein
MDKIIPWWQQKTTWTAVAAICTAAGAYFAGEIGFAGLVAAAFGGIAVIFGRQGIEKSTYIPQLKDRGELVE